MSGDFWKEKRVWISGHTGFKGSWLSFWLSMKEAKIAGYALAPETEPSLFRELNLASLILASTFSDIRDRSSLAKHLEAFQPEIVFHLAAQPLVRLSYLEPVRTFETNVMGTTYLLEALRNLPSVRAVVIVTTDKCYLNKGLGIPFKEQDALGGGDPYSSSKAAQEMIALSYRTSFLNEKGVALATARAGNVIGGGDWAVDRLVPDCMRAFANRQCAQIRRPDSTRPWQYVLESLSGYIRLAEQLYNSPAKLSPSYNFGPDHGDALSVREVVKILQKTWASEALFEMSEKNEGPHEAQFLELDSRLAKSELNWRPRWNVVKALEESVRWYRSFYSKENSATQLCESQIGEYERS